MLLKEWWAWWDALRPLQPQEMLDQRRVLVVADSGWKLDRDQELEEWRKTAEGATGWRLRDGVPEAPKRDARREVRGLFVWLRGKFWGDPSQTTGFAEDAHSGPGD